MRLNPGYEQNPHFIWPKVTLATPPKKKHTHTHVYITEQLQTHSRQ